MSKNLSRTLFYEFYKSDPNFIYESVEEYRNYKSDPDFADKTIEEYRRVKAFEKKEATDINESAANDKEASSDESLPYQDEIESQNESVQTEVTLATYENEIDIASTNETESEIKIENEGNIVDGIQIAITALKLGNPVQQEFERSLEQFWTRDDTATQIFDSKSPSICSSETLSTLTSATDLNTNRSKKRTKSKFKIPKSQSAINLRKVKSRYMDVFKKNE